MDRGVGLLSGVPGRTEQVPGGQMETDGAHSWGR